MNTKTTIKFEPNDDTLFHQTIALGPLKLPEGTHYDEGELICFGEDESWVHCVLSHTGVYYGVFKEWPNKQTFYHVLRELNPYV